VHKNIDVSTEILVSQIYLLTIFTEPVKKHDFVVVIVAGHLSQQLLQLIMDLSPGIPTGTGLKPAAFDLSQPPSRVYLFSDRTKADF
jgi:hypothetical protein